MSNKSIEVKKEPKREPRKEPKREVKKTSPKSNRTLSSNQFYETFAPRMKRSPLRSISSNRIY